MEDNKQDLYHQLHLLSDRFTFFLLATSFLVVAFVSLVVLAGELSAKLVLLAHFVAALASFLSVAFFIINYLTAKTAFESGKGKQIEPVKWLAGSLTDIGNFVINPLNYSLKGHMAYTWFVPLVFCVFWGAAWGVVVSWHGPVIFFPGVFVITLFYILTGRYGWGIPKKNTGRGNGATDT